MGRRTIKVKVYLEGKFFPKTFHVKSEDTLNDFFNSIDNEDLVGIDKYVFVTRKINYIKIKR